MTLSCCYSKRKIQVLIGYFAQLALLEEKRAVNDEIIRQNELLSQDSGKLADQLQLNALQAQRVEQQNLATDPARAGEFRSGSALIKATVCSRPPSSQQQH